MNQCVAITYKENSSYPTAKYSYNPSVKYPEYPFGNQIAQEENYVYDMVRSTLYKMGYDRENYGTKNWNPLKEVIKERDTVLLKPNWVMHFNKALDNQSDLSALVTHPSVVRAIVDYVFIALHGSGRIYVADAPMQECNIDIMFDRSGYRTLFDFWDKNISGIEIRDLRHYSTVIDNNVILDKKNNDYNEPVVVDLKSKSYHCMSKNENKKYKVSQYLEKNTQTYHNENHHEYAVNKLALEADVIINIPKPKCHRLAGMTAALKNMVGIIYDKDCLPHRKIGSPKEGGDAYKESNIFKRFMEAADEKKTESSLKEAYSKAKVYSFFDKVFYVLGSMMTHDKSRVGGWYGNDTIWRTILDLNTIINYADKNGNIHDTIQRKIVTIGDMVLCGQKNGPVKPTPKKLGMIMMSENSYDFDSAMCKIMGFDYTLIRYISEYAKEKEDSINVIFNDETTKLSAFDVTDSWKFEPHDMWKEYES